MVEFTVSDIIKTIITCISTVDFLVFVVLFLTFIGFLPYKAKDISTKIVSVLVITFFILYKIIHIRYINLVYY